MSIVYFNKSNKSMKRKILIKSFCHHNTCRQGMVKKVSFILRKKTSLSTESTLLVFSKEKIKHLYIHKYLKVLLNKIKSQFLKVFKTLSQCTLSKKLKYLFQSFTRENKINPRILPPPSTSLTK